MFNLDTIILDFIKSSETPPLHSSLSVGLVGEQTRQRTKDSLAYRLGKKDFDVKEIFTGRNKFTFDRGNEFDVLIGVRPCQAEETLIRSAQFFGKKFLVLPCNCGNLHKRVMNLITKFGVKQMWIAPQPSSTEGQYERHAWYVLHNL